MEKLLSFLLITCLSVQLYGQPCDFLVPGYTFTFHNQMKADFSTITNFNMNDSFIVIIINKEEILFIDVADREQINLTNIISSLNHQFKGVKYFDNIEENKIYLSPKKSLVFNSDTISWDYNPAMYQPLFQLYNVDLNGKSIYGIYAPSIQFIRATSDFVTSAFFRGYSVSFLEFKYNFNNNELELVPILFWIKDDEDFYMPIESLIPNLWHHKTALDKTFTIYNHKNLNTNDKYYCICEINNKGNSYNVSKIYDNTCWVTNNSTFTKLFGNFKVEMIGSFWYFYTGYDFRVFNNIRDTTIILPIDFEESNRVVEFIVKDNRLLAIFETKTERMDEGSQSLRYNFAYEYAEYNLQTFEKVNSCFIQQEGDKKWLKFDASGSLIKQVSIEENKILIHDMHIAN